MTFCPDFTLQIMMQYCDYCMFQQWHWCLWSLSKC